MSQTYEHCDMAGSVFRDINLGGVTFEDVNLAGATIRNANLEDFRIEDANIKGLMVFGFRIDKLIEDDWLTYYVTRIGANLIGKAQV